MAAIALTGITGEEWYAGGPRRRRQTLARERRAYARSSLTLRREELGNHLIDVARLLAKHQAKFGRSMDEASALGYLRVLADSFGQAAQVLLLKDHSIRAFCLLLNGGAAVDARTYGSDPLDPEEMSYFRLVVHEPTRYARLRGVRTLTLGPGTYGSKTRHGADLEARWWVQLAGKQPGHTMLRSARDDVRAELLQDGVLDHAARLYGDAL